MKDKLLAIPHIGTALGHFYRTALVLDRYVRTHKICIAIPEPFIKQCRPFLRSEIEIRLPRKTRWCINCATGAIDTKEYLSALSENKEIFDTIRPNLMVGDPGVQTAIVASKHSIEWVGIMHGCYLPFPAALNIDGSYLKLLKRTWSVLNEEIDRLVNIGTNGVFNRGAQLRNTGKVVVPNSRTNEPLEAGEYLDLNAMIDPSWQKHAEVELLITCCSTGSVIPSREFTSSLAGKMRGHISVAGTSLRGNCPGMTLAGKNINYRYLVGRRSTVLTHGGHGTLQAISSAKRVIMIPGDFDQLYNSIIAHAVKGWELVFDKDWFEIADSGEVFRREIRWNNLTVDNSSGELMIQGLNIFRAGCPSGNALAA